MGDVLPAEPFLLLGQHLHLFPSAVLRNGHRFFAFLAVRRKVSLSTGSFPADQLSNALHRPAVLFGKRSFPARSELPASCRTCMFLAVWALCWPTVTPTPLLHTQPASPPTFSVCTLTKGFYLYLQFISSSFSFHFVHLMRGCAFLSLMKAPHWLPTENIIKCYLISQQE